MMQLTSGTAESGATAILNLLQQYDITADHILGCCFDTTSTNSGGLTGIMVRLEESMQKKFIHLYCRHHSYER